MKILITGCAGFIGSAVSQYLLNDNEQIIGIDNLNNYYDPQLKYARLNKLKQNPHFNFYQCSIENKDAIMALFRKESPTHVIHLAAQVGVRYSLENPEAYIQSNLVGFAHILEACRKFKIDHLIYASSSSIYGNQEEIPYKLSNRSDKPISLYAATKKSNELMAYSYSYLYDMPTTGLRYFTVYGPWGRPDMAPYIFVKHILSNKPIYINNDGNHQRDFTYIDDVVQATTQLLNGQHFMRRANSPPFKIYNVGFGKPIELLYFIDLIEKETGYSAIKQFRDKQAGDVTATWSDVDDLIADIQYKPRVSIEQGIPLLIHWVKEFHQI